MSSLNPKIFRWANQSIPGQHEGVSATSATGVATIDLGIRHNNFSVALNVMGGATELANGYVFAWKYGAKRGTFDVTVFKRPAAYGAWIAATAVVGFSFIAHEKAKDLPVT